MKESNKVFTFSNVDVSKHVNTKNNLKYLNWAYVMKFLRSHDANSSFQVKEFPEINLQTGQATGRKVNYCEGVNGEGAYVTVSVKFNGQTITESLPCYDYNNKSVIRPDIMLVNKTIKRCFVKCASILTGLGISLYINGANSNIPETNHSNPYPQQQPVQQSKPQYQNNNNNQYHNQYQSNNGRNNGFVSATRGQTAYIYRLIGMINLNDPNLVSNDIKDINYLKALDSQRKLFSLGKQRASRAIKWLISVIQSQNPQSYQNQPQPQGNQSQPMNNVNQQPIPNNNNQPMNNNSGTANQPQLNNNQASVSNNNATNDSTSASMNNSEVTVTMDKNNSASVAPNSDSSNIASSASNATTESSTSKKIYKDESDLPF